MGVKGVTGNVIFLAAILIALVIFVILVVSNSYTISTPGGNFAFVTHTAPIDPVCGDCFYSIGESCEDGNTNSNDGCSSMCQLEYCGDGIIQGKEQCDKGQTGACGGGTYCNLDTCTCRAFAAGSTPPVVHITAKPAFVTTSGTVQISGVIIDTDKDLDYYEICTGGSSQPQCGGGGGSFGCGKKIQHPGSGILYPISFNQQKSTSGTGQADYVIVRATDKKGNVQSDTVLIPVYP